MQRYFTLIELLVVIAILSILAGLLLPALNSARGKARDVQCLNNQKSIGFGLLEYDSQYGCGVDFVVEPEKLRWQAAVIRLVQTQRFDSAEIRSMPIWKRSTECGGDGEFTTVLPGTIWTRRY